MVNRIPPRGFVYIFYFLFLSISWSCRMLNDDCPGIKEPIGEGGDTQKKNISNCVIQQILKSIGKPVKL